jgi:hypothetical protein
MGRNRLTPGTREATALESALFAYDRVREYPREGLSSNERTIIQLGAELLRLRALCQRAGVDVTPPPSTP